MAGVIAFNDRVAAEWYAPAGLNRGGIDTAVQVYTRLTKAERDTLYEGRVNPIAMFVGQGIVAWGQKTLQAKASALDRINVRRLLIALKKYIASSAKYLVFEQNTVATRTRLQPPKCPMQQQAPLQSWPILDRVPERQRRGRGQYFPGRQPGVEREQREAGERTGNP